MPTLTSRKQSRQQLATLLTAGVTDLVAVYDHEVRDFGGRSPVATIHSNGTRTTFPDYTREYHRFLITLLWKRSDDDLTEDYVDDLAADVRQTLIDNAEAAGYWQDLQFDDEADGFSEMGYWIIDGVQYRWERIRVTAYIVST